MHESGAPPGSRAGEVCARRSPRANPSAPAAWAHDPRAGPAWEEAASSQPPARLARLARPEPAYLVCWGSVHGACSRDGPA